MNKLIAVFLLFVSGVANAALNSFQSTVGPAPGAPSYASDLSGSVNAVWDTTAGSFVSFDMVVSGFPVSLELTSDHHFFIEAPFIGASSYAMPNITIGSLATPCCGPFFDSSTGMLYLHFDGYTLSTSPGQDPNDFTDVAIALNALNFGNVDFVLYNFFNAPGAPDFQDYGAPLVVASLMQTTIPVPPAFWLFGSALGLLCTSGNRA